MRAEIRQGMEKTRKATNNETQVSSVCRENPSKRKKKSPLSAKWRHGPPRLPEKTMARVLMGRFAKNPVSQDSAVSATLVTNWKGRVDSISSDTGSLWNTTSLSTRPTVKIPAVRSSRFVVSGITKPKRRLQMYPNRTENMLQEKADKMLLKKRNKQTSSTKRNPKDTAVFRDH